MPLGVLSELDAKNELARFGIIISEKEIEVDIESHKNEDSIESDSQQDARSENVISFSTINRGRGNKEEVPESLRAFIASEAIAGANPSKLAEDFNVSKSSISAYKVGAHSTASYNSPSAQLIEANQSAIDRIIGPAQRKIIKAIESITDDKLMESKARDAASIASSLSSVVKNLKPEEKTGTNLQINVFAPRVKEEEDFEVLQVNQ